LIGRCILSLIFGWNSERAIVRFFNRITDPVLAVVGVITPRIVPTGLLIVFAVVWLFVARVALFFGLALLGVRPVLS
jgi:YggT family protein